MTSSYARPSPQSSSSPRRPFCIAELANRATHNLWDPSKGLKQWLKTADGFRKAGRAYHEAGDLEAAFVEFAKAATIILEKLPLHKEYFTLLTPTQRHNLGLNGQDILMHLGDIKPILVDRYERWTAQHPEEAAAVRTALDAGVKMQVDSRPDRYPDHDESGWQAHEAARREAQLRREDARRDEARRANAHSTGRNREDALLAPRRAPNVSREPSLVRRDRLDRSGSEPVTPVSGKEQERRREHERERDDTRHYQEEAKRREEEEALRRQDKEHEGILRRQQEAEAASRAARRSVVPSPTYAPAHSNHTYQYAQPSPRNGEPVYEDALPPSMPLESPTRSQLLSVKGPSYPIPITTTSPAPPDAHVQYPHLMSQHQLSQGYTPSLQSMFNYPTLKPSEVGPSSLLFIPGASKTLSAHLYPADRLPRPSAPVPVVHQTVPPGNQYTATYSNLSRTQGAPPPPAPPIHADSERFRTASQESARIIRERASEDRVPELKTVSLPRDCLPRFLSIAALNTSRNRETCGLLLGRDQKGKYVVTTLLIPRQHSTSDTCTMDEEELVMQFTEERSLITLGWIHTHPSQSCFMSSVDLHTHSGFQRMLPESFAVVCAPKSTPNFGIFRLTDPPGLQTILNCHAKEAFHPHPDLPIYTDADKGHVQMKDMPLEIVDLR
ncbi:hypothetical protein L210DRAFT_3639282 [Boletus edulis BED1]|uniref:MPN domain-containing protein n=1 Tax=Boletus edulis BED1 TaxID=1328754 RepID=A0AAD4GLV3_BOLED|nr:hypothetical protein L210DRAFT_3639282 [Boletus edulis BED1]